MGQYQRWVGLVLIKLAVDIAKSRIHGVGGCHGGEGEVNAAGEIYLHQSVSQQDGGLGFSGTGDVLHNEQLRAVAKSDLYR